MKKQYIQIAEYTPGPHGRSDPKVIKWSDGRSFRIDEVLDITFSLNNEYKGYRYTVRIGSVEKYIYLDNNQWYVFIPEKKVLRAYWNSLH